MRNGDALAPMTEPTLSEQLRVAGLTPAPEDTDTDDDASVETSPRKVGPAKVEASAAEITPRKHWLRPGAPVRRLACSPVPKVGVIGTIRKKTTCSIKLDRQFYMI
jgi:hypothetical protein